MKYKNEVDTAVKAVRASGDIIRRSYSALGQADVSEKRAFDMVTVVDVESQEKVVSILRSAFPGDFIVAEERLDSEVNAGIDETARRRWYIDPLDGTTNYIHAYPIFAANVAFYENNRAVVGATYDPMRDELFHAVRGGGSFLNGERIHVSDVSDRLKSLVLTGFPFRSKRYIDDYLKLFKRFFLETRGIRRAGSAAIDLAYVACGRAEVFWELTLSSWDLAAGILLVEEAGGRVTDFFGGSSSLETGHIVASNGQFHDWMLAEIQKVFPKGGEYRA